MTLEDSQGSSKNFQVSCSLALEALFQILTNTVTILDGEIGLHVLQYIITIIIILLYLFVCCKISNYFLILA